jgi:hypothetical protein
MNNSTSISNETIDWDVIDVTEFVQIKENYINLDGKTEDYLQIKDSHLSEEDSHLSEEDSHLSEEDNLLSEEDKNIEQKIFTEWKNLIKQNKCDSETNPDNVEELVSYTDSEESYIVEKVNHENLNNVIIIEDDDSIQDNTETRIIETDTAELIKNDKLSQKLSNVVEINIANDTSPIKNVSNCANGDVVITFNENTSKLRKRKSKKRKNKYRRQRGKEIFMIIKIDQWASVHPESLDSEIEMINVRKLFEFIWAEMHPSERYAYFKYEQIDEKYKIAKTNGVFKSILNFFDNMMENVMDFFEDMICFQDKDEKIKQQAKEDFQEKCKNLKKN